jgi:geranylgeranyl diphosphate synthase type II
MADDLKSYLQDQRQQVEARLDALLRPHDGSPPVLVEAMRYSTLAPGKRLRPLLVIMAAEAAGADGSEPLAAACAVEMVHAYSLIHDDLPAMDDDDLRRGQPTCHKQFGEALAILAGDALLTLAFQTLAENYRPATAAGCCLELARGAGAAGMVGGPGEDLAWERERRPRPRGDPGPPGDSGGAGQHPRPQDGRPVPGLLAARRLGRPGGAGGRPGSCYH